MVRFVHLLQNLLLGAVIMEPINILSLLGVIIVCGLPQRSQGEVFTAISDCEPLLDTHRLVINHIDDLIKKEEKKLTVLKKQLSTYKAEHQKAMEDVANYLGNPINAFTLIKRLTKDLEDIDKIVLNQYQQYNTSFDRRNAIFPSDEDLEGAAHALTRLQETYKLEVKDLAEGLLNGIAYSTSLSADDCFELGRALFRGKQYENSIAWMKEALRKYQEGDKSFVHSFTEIDVYDYISWSYYELKDLQNAVEYIRKLLVLDPDHQRAKANESLFLKEQAEKNAEEQKLIMEAQGSTKSDQDLMYEALCRGDYDIPHEISKKLHCFYLIENHPFLRLAPIKAEQKYADPDAYLYYDVISDEEIAHVQDMARPRFKRATVFSGKAGEMVPATYRISKTGWLGDEESTVVKRISQRIQDFTGLVTNSDTSETLQVANYGIGGHYLPHYDYSRKIDLDSTWTTNRIATVLFYLSEVAEGGATVFTDLGLSVFPIKNSALFWMNLHPSGEGDLYTRHAACPVLRGSKWVANKWIHQAGQELVKKCTLEYQKEEWNRVIPKPILKARR